MNPKSRPDAQRIPQTAKRRRKMELPDGFTVKVEREIHGVGEFMTARLYRHGVLVYWYREPAFAGAREAAKRGAIRRANEINSLPVEAPHTSAFPTGA